MNEAKTWNEGVTIPRADDEWTTEDRQPIGRRVAHIHEQVQKTAAILEDLRTRLGPVRREENEKRPEVLNSNEPPPNVSSPLARDLWALERSVREMQTGIVRMVESVDL